MKIEHLRILVDLSKTLNFTKTAEQEGITQPAVSKIIESLEAELKVKLIIRNSKQVKFTQDGYLFAQQVESILLAYDNAVSQIRNSYRTHYESLRIGYTGTPYEIKHIPELIHEFKEKEKKVHFYIQNMQHNELHNGLQNKNIDLIFTTQDDVSSYKSISFTPIREGEFRALIPSDFNFKKTRKIKLADLNGYTLIMMFESNSGPELIKLQRKARQICDKSRIIQANNIQAAMFMVRSGLGICLLPRYIYNDHSKFIHAISLDYPKIIYYGIAYLENNDNFVLKSFINLAKSKFKNK